MSKKSKENKEAAEIGPIEAIHVAAADAVIDAALDADAEAAAEGRPKPLPDALPLLPVSRVVLFPGMVAPISLTEDSTLHLRLSGTSENHMLTVATLNGTEEAVGRPLSDRVYHIATAAVLLKVLRGGDGTSRILVHGVDRVAITGMKQEQPFPLARVERLAERRPGGKTSEALRRQVLRVVREVASLSDLPEEFTRSCEELEDAGKLADLIAGNVSFKVDEQQEILQMTDVEARLRRTYELLENLLHVLRIGSRIQAEVRGEIERHQRDFFLREQIKQLRKELGDNQDLPEEEEELIALVESKGLPKQARETALKEIGRLGRMNPASPEHSVARTYVDWLLALPWNELSPTTTDIRRAKKVLDEDHYDLEEVKDRILEYLSVLALTDALRGPILCFVGPPGVGKTSLGRSIARATGREFYRFSLGGLRDEAEIRGHRRTYIGAMPGRIIKAYKATGRRNPVIMLDEIDKLGTDFRGDPSSALLEVLDPEQNSTFTDNYLDVQFDLSQTLFITTANHLETIPAALRDRMEIIRLSGYTLREKREIAERYLVPRQARENGLRPGQIRFERSAIEKIVEDYTREAGLREAERQIGRICRKVARRIAEKRAKSAAITTRTLGQYLGRERYFGDTADRITAPGIAVGLAWTQVGGEILFIEANSTEGEGKLHLTGQLGDVMKESAQAAISYLRANAEALRIDPERLAKRDYHVHMPAGAIPKDGPSAGVAITTAIASEALGRKVRKGLAMTGEITLKGNVLPVGGIKEKVLAAARAGVRKVILPKLNQKDYDDIPAEVRKKLTFVFVEKADEVLCEALGLSASKGARRRA